MLKIEKMKKTTGDYEGLSFVLGAMTKEETRKNLQAILWDGSCYWATDGHRIHYYYANDNRAEVVVYTLASKDKNTIILEKNEDIKYPDITVLTLFRNNGPKWELEINTTPGHNVTNMGACSRAYTQVIRHMEEDETLNFEYIKALPPDHYTVYFHGPKDCLCFANGNKGAAIMPMRVN